MVRSYTFIQLVVVMNAYSIVAMMGVLISVFGVMFLVKRTDSKIPVPATNEVIEFKLVKKG